MRAPRLLWANHSCLLDVSSGAARTARQMLHCLQAVGYEVAILGTTHFDSPRGVAGLERDWASLSAFRQQQITVKDGPLSHKLLVTEAPLRSGITLAEINTWYLLYVAELEAFKPDIVWYYGGHPVDYLIADEARQRGVRTAALLVNGNYQGARWCRDVDLVLTDSHATAKLYLERSGIECKVLGTFTAEATVVANAPKRERVLFINPTPEKGAFLVASLAQLLEARRQDIVFEVVQSRGDWRAIVRQFTAALGAERESFANVVVTESTPDMRPIYGRARLVIVPSLWFESGARVVPEALFNGLPVIAVDSGGLAELLGGAGFVLRLPPAFHEPPYSKVLAGPELEQIAALIERLYDDEPWYQQHSERALSVAHNQHSLRTSTQRLLNAFAPLLPQALRD